MEEMKKDYQEPKTEEEVKTDSKRRKGSLTVEATLSLTTFLFLFMTIYSIVTICRTQTIIGSALHNTAKEISQYTYLYSLTGLHEDITDALDTSVKDDIKGLADGVTGVYDNIIQLGDDASNLSTVIGEDDLSTLVNGVNGSVSKLEEDMNQIGESVHNVSDTLEKLADDPKSFMIGLAKIGVSDGMNLAKSKLITPPICRGFIKKHFKFHEDQSAEEYLKELGIVPKDGATGSSYLNGLDFSNSSLFATKDYDIVLRVEYQIQVFPWLPVDIKLTFCQTAITRGWADGDGRHLTFDKTTVEVAERENGSYKEEPTITPTPEPTPEEEEAIANFLASIPESERGQYNKAYLIKIYRTYGEEAFTLIKEQGIDAYLALKVICQKKEYQLSITKDKMSSVVISIIKTMNECESKYGAKYKENNIQSDTTAILELVLQYGDSAINVITNYGEDGFYIIAFYGQNGIDYLESHAKDGVEFILYFGDDWKNKVGIIDFDAYKKVVADNGQGAIDDICSAYPDLWKNWDEETWKYYIDLYTRSEPYKISQEDKVKISAWEYPPKEELYIKYKEVYDNPDYYDQSTGEIKWPANDGFVEGSKKDIYVDNSVVFKRYGGPSGEFLGNATDSYESRALAPHSEEANQYYYRPTDKFLISAGTVAPWFGSDGGGEQFVKYKADGSKYSIQELLDEGLLEDITDKVKKGEVIID